MIFKILLFIYLLFNIKEVYYFFKLLILQKFILDLNIIIIIFICNF